MLRIVNFDASIVYIARYPNNIVSLNINHERMHKI